MRRTLRLMTALTLALGCGGATETPAPSPTDVGGEPPPASAARTRPTPAPTETAGDERVSFVAHAVLTDALDRAEVRLDGDLWASFGQSAGMKYTLGGWGTRCRPLTVDGVGAVAGQGRDTRLILPRAAADSRLTLRVRSAAAGQLSLVVDGEVLDERHDVPAGLATVTFDLGEEARGEGEMALGVRAPRTGRVGSERLGVAVAALRLGKETALEGAPTRREDGAVELPEKSSLAWTLMVPEGARLQVPVTSGAVAVTLRQDGREPSDVGTASADSPLTVDLSDRAGEAVRVELKATEASVLSAVSVEVPERSLRELTRPTNLMVVLIDTLRADKLGPYDPDTRVRTPGLDAFVRNATTFARAHSQENWTKPSVATLLSGLMPWEHTATQHESVVPRAVEMLPELLKAQGFQTGSFIANGYVSDRFGFDQGWDSYRNYIREGRRTHAEYVAGDVLAWLDRRDTDKPFFLYVHTIDPHVPYRPPDEDLALYGDPNYRGVVDFSRDHTLLENVKRGRVRMNDRDRAHLEALYDGEITYHDRHFRSILDGLDRRGVGESTMVVITSDHGEELFDHGSVGHGHSVYEELLHVPLFVKLPGATPRRIDRSVGLVDVMPTILEAFGLPIPGNLAGKSFLDELRGGGRGLQRGTVSAFMDHWRTLNVGRWKLVERPGRAPALYDLDRDPDEANDLSEQRPLVRRWLRGLLGIRLAESADEGTAERPRRRPAAERTVIDEETAAQLRALGYTGD